MKKLLRSAVILTGILLLFCISAAAETLSGNCGTGVTWSLDTETGAMVISGNGKIEIEAYSSNVTLSPWWDYSKSVKTIVVEEGVTRIDDYAFWGCTNLQSISVPASVSGIGVSAFANANSITISEENENFAAVDDVVFRKTTVTENGVAQDVLTELVQYPKKKQGAYEIPKTVTKIASRAFASCQELTSVTIPDSVTIIPSYAFVDCNSLSEVHWGTGVTTIGSSAFQSCKSLVSIEIPEGVTSIGYEAFKWCDALEEVVFPKSIVSIGGVAFSSCPLREINLPEGLQKIGDGAFGTNATAKKVTIPASVTSIGYGVFVNAEGVEVSPSNPNYSSLDGVLFNKDKTVLLQYPSAREASYYFVPQGVTTIESYAFGRTTELKTIEFPDTLTTLKGGVFRSYLTGGPTTVKKTAYFYGDAPECASTSNLLFSQIYYLYGTEGWTTPTWNNINAEPFDVMTPDVMPHEIYYSANGGSGAPREQCMEWGTGIILSSVVPVRTGYTFLGWALTADATTPMFQPSDYYEGNGSVVLYAVWEPDTFTVTYDANGGANAPEPQTKVYEVALTLSEQAPTRDHYRFLGWATYTTAQTATYEPGASFTTDADTILYAVWDPVIYTVTYHANGGSGAPATQQKIGPAPLTLSSTIPTKPGYTFLGWAAEAGSMAADYAAGAVYEINADVTLYAVWERTVSADTPIVTLSGGEAAPGETVKLTATVSNNTGLAGFRFYIKADTSVFSIGETDGELDITQGDFTSNGQLMSNTAEGGWQVMWYHTSNVTRNGSLFSVTFRVSETAPDGTYPIELICSAEDTIKADGTLVPLAVNGNIITISSGTLGDVNGDNKVTNADVIRLARYIVGLETLSEMQLATADVNGDGKATNADVIRLARYIIGLDSL